MGKEAEYGYIRVSKASEEGRNLETQRRVLHEYGLRDDRIYTDIASGRTMERVGWKQMREQLRPGDSVVICYLDRLCRNALEGLQTIDDLCQSGIGIIALTEGIDTRETTPAGRLQQQILMAVAELQYNTTSERVRAGLARAREEGRRLGRPVALEGEKLEAVKAAMAGGMPVVQASRVFGVSQASIRKARDGEYEY